MTFDMYEPLYTTIKEPTLKIPPYYEVRVWINHEMIIRKEFRLLKDARKFYKDKFEEQEDRGKMYVEIIRVKTLKK